MRKGTEPRASLALVLAPRRRVRADTQSVSDRQSRRPAESGACEPVLRPHGDRQG